MAEEQPQQAAPSRMAPPTEPSDAAFAHPPSAWPQIIGIIAIVLGILGTLGAVWGILGMIFAEDLMSLTPGDMDMDVFLEPMRRRRTWLIALTAVTFACAIFLFIVGIGILRRRQWSVRTAKAWSAAKMLLIGGQTVLSYGMQQEQFELMAQNPNMPAQMPMFGTTWVVVTMAIGVAWGCALPLFMLIWFGRRKIRDETATWT